jgi:hypothetical protein
MMAFDEHARHELHLRLVEAIGEEAASTLMSSLPPDRWDHLANKDDLNALRAATRHDIQELRVATQHDIQELRVATQHDMTSMREVLEARIDGTKHEVLAALHSEINGALTAQTRTMIFTMAGSLVALAGLAMAMGQLA